MKISPAMTIATIAIAVPENSIGTLRIRKNGKFLGTVFVVKQEVVADELEKALVELAAALESGDILELTSH